jgi:macrodomain Ter protein organizer (MatP/YcbG family)
MQLEIEPFRIASLQEARWTKAWLLKQIYAGRFPALRVEILRHIESVDDVKQFLGRHLSDIKDRQRLQKALSARRTRAANKSLPNHCKKITTELEYEAREILLAIAKSRGLTTSELIRTTFQNEFDRLD